MSDEKKIIIDEDWKTQVAAEKEAAERQQAAKSAGQGAVPQAQSPASEAVPHGKLPPASFEMLLTMFVTEAMTGLGQLPHPMSGKLELQPEIARYAIDMLEMLAEKTKGNLSPVEETGLTQLLHQLRMAFVAVQSGTGTVGQ